MTNTNKDYIVFTDLDGTFLDHNTYSYEAALPALNRLQVLGIPVIPVTSKTQAELDLLNLPLNNDIAITENGTVIKQHGKLETSGIDYAAVIDFIESLPESLQACITGFHDMDIETVITSTGLSEDNAKAAKTRNASEPFLWSGNDAQMQDLKTRAAAHTMTITRGGRFYHLMGEGGKDEAIQHLLAQPEFQSCTSIALGDGPNDAAMLGAVDIGVIIPNPHGKMPTIENPKGKIRTAPHPGPAGWSAAINGILDEWE